MRSVTRYLDVVTDDVRRFMRMETSGGLLLIAATVLAMLVKNSPWAEIYSGFLALEGQLRIGDVNIEKALFLWVNDGWMAVFFFLVGLEIKREVLHGHLRDLRQIALPAAGALGGVVVPAAVYLSFTWNDPDAVIGWAIPTATDIAFSLGVLALLGSRVPVALKIFLMTLAIIDDLIAILVIAFFFTSSLSYVSLLGAAACIAMLVILNVSGVKRVGPYIVTGAVLWVLVLKSGVHATLAGVITALMIPSFRDERRGGEESIGTLIHQIHPWAAFAILPLFAFVNAGIQFDGLNWANLLGPVPLGIALALLVGKPVGVFLFAKMIIWCRLARLPEGVNNWHLLGIACLCGIGFTMSLFIGGLAFAEGGPGYARIDRFGILAGSFLSALLGYFVLRLSLRREITPTAAGEQPDAAAGGGH